MKLQKPSPGTRMQLIVTFSGTLIFFVVGSSMGWASPSLAKFEHGEESPHISSSERSWILSCVAIGAVVTQPLVGYFTNRLGRKVVLLSLTVVFLASWLLIVFASSVAELYIANLLAGAGMGTSFAVGPAYLAEIATDRVRGAMAAVFQVMMNLGVFFSYCVGPYVSPSTLGIICVVFPVLFFVSFVWMPESPYFYLLHDRREDAERTLMRLRGVDSPDDVTEELHEMELYVQESRREANSGGFRELLANKGCRRALVITMGLAGFQVLSGNNAVLGYSTSIFESSNRGLKPEFAVMITGAAQVALGIACSSLVDIAGRRPLLLVSTLGCTLSLAVEGLYFFLQDNQGVDMTGYDWVSVIAIVMFLVVYTIGLGGLPLVMVGELFPTHVKGTASSFVVLWLSALGIGVPKIYQVLQDEFGIYASFWSFAVCCLIGAGFVAVVVPETKGRSLRDIDQEMNSDEVKDKSPRDIDQQMNSSEAQHA